MVDISEDQQKSIGFKWVRENGEIIFRSMDYDFIATVDVIVHDELVKDTVEEWCVKMPNGEILTYGKHPNGISQDEDGSWKCPMSSGIVEHIELDWKAYIKLHDLSALQRGIEILERKKLRTKAALEKYGTGFSDV